MAGKPTDHVARRGGRARAAIGLDSQAQRNIGENLKTLYQQVADEPVPERFVRLLRKLEEDGAESESG